MKLPVMLAILGVVHSNCILKRKLLPMLEFIILLIVLVLPVVVMLIIAWCIISGSNVDPDDNGLLKSKEAKEKWRQRNLKNLRIQIPFNALARCVIREISL